MEETENEENGDSIQERRSGGSRKKRPNREEDRCIGGEVGGREGGENVKIHSEEQREEETEKEKK